MNIKCIAMGKNMPPWVYAGFETYRKRLIHHLPFDCIEIPLLKRHKSTDNAHLIDKEGKAMLAHVGEKDYVIALDRKGKQWDTEQLAVELQGWREQWQTLCILIGGPEGLAPACLQRANLRWSLSKLTLPHPLVRVVLAEQLYRAWSIQCGHPYHR